jgi:RNA polymerase sigma factor (sigma-70 family)
MESIGGGRSSSRFSLESLGFESPRPKRYRRGVDETLEEWFQREILPHEAALVRFLARKWTYPQDVQDIRHDIYARVLEAAERKRPVSPRGFLFGVARHLLIDRVRRDRIVAIDLLEDMNALNVLIDEVSPERVASGREQVQRLSRLFDRLPGRCREVVWMRRIEDLPQKEIASRLGIAEATVEKHLVRGIGLLADALYGAVEVKESTQDEQQTAIEPKHGD